ncbi:MAG: ribosome-binding factor A [Holosporales bacterium]|jgi:ribosome-binding factor A|nr:ribosome-binding factor A [Holosporales bacterium]
MSHLNLFVNKKEKTVSLRNDKIAAQIRECFSFALIRGDFPLLPNHEEESKLPCPITLTHVNLSKDLRNATIFFMPLGGTKKIESLRFFELQTHHFKELMAKKMKLKFIPNIIFKFDNSFDYSDRISKLLMKTPEKQ